MMTSLPMSHAHVTQGTGTAFALTKHGRLPPSLSLVNRLSRLPLLPSLPSHRRSSHGVHEFTAAGFGHCGGRTVWPPPGRSAWFRGLPHARRSEDYRWVLAQGESALRGSGARDRGLFPVTLVGPGGSREKLRAWGLRGEMEHGLCGETESSLSTQVGRV